MKNHYQLAIIGAGPIGLIAAKKAQKANLQTIIFETQPIVGGQIMELYPKKEIEDMPNLPIMNGDEYVELLVSELEFDENLKLQLNTTVEHLTSIDDGVLIETTAGSYTANNVIVATGLGVYSPRKMGLVNEEKFDEIRYSIKELNFLRDKKVLIMGGGDSAIDWAKMVSRVSEYVYLIHRRNAFRGNIQTIEGIETIKILTPYIPIALIEENGRLKGLELQNVASNETLTLEADYILVNYGNIPRGDTFGLEKFRTSIKVNPNFQADKHIYVAGDVAGYEGKKKRILHGVEELDVIFAQLTDH